jgi:hypothetical protein
MSSAAPAYQLCWSEWYAGAELDIPYGGGRTGLRSTDHGARLKRGLRLRISSDS